jgi:pimeloyl-ACP methyl ester carboxylesterase
MRLTTFERAGLHFDVSDRGPLDGEVLVLLHGFPQDHRSWNAVVPGLHEAGLRTLAPDQRGYSPGARVRGAGQYRWRHLVDDVLALLDAAEAERAHVVGHDWGGFVAWALAADRPDRVSTLTALSTPHPAAMTRAMLRGQALRSWYMGLFQVPGLAEWLLRPGSPAWGATMRGLPHQAAAHCADLMSEPDALRAGLDWYRALPRELVSPSVHVGRVGVPTLYVWGTRDPALGRAAALATADYVTGPYRFEAVVGAGHWLPDTRADRVASLVAEHVSSPA